MCAAVQRDAALMNGNHSGHLEQRGISLHLVPWDAVDCTGLSRWAMDRWGSIPPG